jgi:RNA polymerase sigma factor FliA
MPTQWVDPEGRQRFPHKLGASDMSTAQTTERRFGEQTLELWQEYKDTGDARLRDRLVLTLAPMVKYIVYHKLRELPARSEAEDFIACGLEALIHCVDRYDPEKGVTLEQFAWTRIHDAVLDELRREDWTPPIPASRRP